MTRIEVEVELEPELRYTEETGRVVRSLPVRDCLLWKKGIEEPISGLNILSFRQRFGVVAVPCEGIGGVETMPEFRRQGYMSRLMRLALRGISERVGAAFIADAVMDVYEKFGFVTCLPESTLLLRVREVEMIAGKCEVEENGRLRQFTPDDLPALVDLYNREHAGRPGTLERQADWNRLFETKTWRPGSEVIVYERGRQLAGYAIVTGQRFGKPNSTYVAEELTAVDVDAAKVLLVEMAVRCWQMRLSEFEVREPLDSTVGRAAKEIGCRYEQAFRRSGGMMGRILKRRSLLQLLEQELQQRLPDNGLRRQHAAAFAALCRGEIIADNGLLLRLLLGYWSLSDASSTAARLPVAYKPVCEAWFPGGGGKELQTAYGHCLDRY